MGDGEILGEGPDVRKHSGPRFWKQLEVEGACVKLHVSSGSLKSLVSAKEDRGKVSEDHRASQFCHGVVLLTPKTGFPSWGAFFLYKLSQHILVSLFSCKGVKFSVYWVCLTPLPQFRSVTFWLRFWKQSEVLWLRIFSDCKKSKQKIQTRCVAGKAWSKQQNIGRRRLLKRYGHTSFISTEMGEALLNPALWDISLFYWELSFWDLGETVHEHLPLQAEMLKKCQVFITNNHR